MIEAKKSKLRCYLTSFMGEVMIDAYLYKKIWEIKMVIAEHQVQWIPFSESHMKYKQSKVQWLL